MRCARVAWPSSASTSASTSRATSSSGVTDSPTASRIDARAAFAARRRAAISGAKADGRARTCGAGSGRPARARRPASSASRSSKNVITTSASQQTRATGISHGTASNSPAVSTAAGMVTLTGLVIALTTSTRVRSLRVGMA